MNEIATSLHETSANSPPIEASTESRDDLLARRNIYLAGHSKSQEDFDKTLLTVSSGALAATIGFIDKIVPLAKASHTYALEAGLVALVVAISTALFSHLAAVKANRSEIDAIDRQLRGHAAARVTRWHTAGLTANYTAFLLTVLGVGAIVAFACFNL